MTTQTDRVGMAMENEKSLLRWGGLVGILAFIVWIVDLPLYGYADPFVPDGLMRFPDFRVALAVNTILCMTIAFLSVTFVLVLYRALRGTSQSLALLGSVLGVIGYIATAFGDASTFLAFAPISDLYHATATPEMQTTVVLLWDATRGLTNTFFFIGILFMMLGFIILGIAMLRSPSFGRRFGGISILLGLIGIVGVVASLFIPGSIGMQVMGIGVFANLIFLSLFGWKVYRLSKTT
jgi:hypothetical protein